MRIKYYFCFQMKSAAKALRFYQSIKIVRFSVNKYLNLSVPRTCMPWVVWKNEPFLLLFLCRDGSAQFRPRQEEEERGVEWRHEGVFPENSTENFGECREGGFQSAPECDGVISRARDTLLSWGVCVCVYVSGVEWTCTLLWWTGGLKNTIRSR